MLPCKECAYCGKKIGSSKIKCVFDWKKANAHKPLTIKNMHKSVYDFPNDYDPIWGEDTCVAFLSNTNERDKDLTVELDNDLLGLLLN